MGVASRHVDRVLEGVAVLCTPEDQDPIGVTAIAMQLASEPSPRPAAWFHNPRSQRRRFRIRIIPDTNSGGLARVYYSVARP